MRYVPGRFRAGFGRSPAGQLPLFLTVVLVAVLAGGASYAWWTDSEPAPTRASDPDSAQVEQARADIQNVRLVFSFMSSALTGATGGIEAMTDGASQVFDAIDSGRTGVGQAAEALAGAPDVQAVGAQVSTSLTGLSAALSQGEQLAGAGEQVATLVDPLIALLEASPAPGTADSLAQLKELRAAANELSDSLASVGDLQRSLDELNASIGPAADSTAAGLASARTAADQLQTGLETLAGTRDTVDGAVSDVAQGMDRLTGVLESIDTRLTSAEENLTPGMDAYAEDGTLLADLPVPVVDVHNTGRSLVVGAAAGLITMLVLLFVRRREPAGRVRADNAGPVDRMDDAEAADPGAAGSRGDQGDAPEAPETAGRGEAALTPAWAENARPVPLDDALPARSAAGTAGRHRESTTVG